MNRGGKILILGASGMAGKALLSKLKNFGYCPIMCPGRREVDLLKQAQVDEYFAKTKPDYAFMLAGRVGGIADNLASWRRIQYRYLERHCHFRFGKVRC